ncbi:MAG TPA: lytic transglycosylase domain-containing protein [Acetobacteraceae bacterium]
MRFLLCALLLGLPCGVLAAAPPASHRPALRVAEIQPADLCEAAIATAEYTGRLPAGLLEGIALEESGRRDARTGTVRPWPWTINVGGVGQFFATKAEAVAAVRAQQASGVRSIDVGCMQINLMHHPDAFASLDEAFDPPANARYAARFLNSLHAAGDDWRHAIGAYHSETPALAEAYRALVLARWPHPALRAPGGAYRDFATPVRVYAAFAPRDQVYGAFVVPAAASTARLRQ